MTTILKTVLLATLCGGSLARGSSQCFAGPISDATLLVYATPQQAGAGTMSGRILSLEGNPAAQLRVAAIDVSEAADGKLLGRASSMSIAETDAAGRYRLENIPAGEYYIVADPFGSPSYYPGAAALSGATIVAITAASMVNAGDFTLVRSNGILRSVRSREEGQGGRYSGSIKAAWGDPIPNVTLLLFNAQQDARFMTVTDKAGAFDFSGLPSGPFSMDVLSAVPSGAVAQGFERLQETFVIGPGERLQQDIGLRMVVGNPNLRPGLRSPAPSRPDLYVAIPPRTRLAGAPEPRKVPAFILEREVIREPAPAYPQSAKDARIEGAVALDCVFGIDGRVTSLRIVTRDANPELSRAAVEAVSHWRYVPAAQNTAAIESTGQLIVYFTLPN